MTKYIIRSLGILMLFGAFTLGFNACKIEEIENPNAPEQGFLENGGATLSDLKLLASGLESVARSDMQFHYWTVSVIGREYWDLRQTDPRYTGELLGAGGSPLDPNGFLTTRAYFRHFRMARNAWMIINAADNNAASLTDAQKNGLKGFARTMMAYGLLLEANRQYDGGIRVDVKNPDALGPFLDYEGSLREVAAMLDAANLELNGASLIWSCSLGDAARLKQFNRAVAARVAMYQNDKAKMRSLLAETWMDADGNMDEGVYHVFGQGGNDLTNPLYVVADKDQFVVHPSVTANAEVGDTRYSTKTRVLSSPDPGSFSSDDLTGNVQVAIYSSLTDAVPIIRNEELVLMWAEANIGHDNAAAVAAINKVRAAAGLADYAGATDDAALVTQLLHERRYSLYGEGHRWMDMRRYGRLSQIPTDRPGDVVHSRFPRP
ncbi:MAG: RagB/SusD family nutrient uptake outer membrane protein [Saprospiraceae bacterium]|nr:RagB/SusD family nutrient uptake outer membrane protein [Saprospiraceae bacterium]